MLEAVVKQSHPLPPGSKLLILGAGFSGQHIASVAKALGSYVLCSRRKQCSQGADIAFDSDQQILPPLEFLKPITHLLSCIPPRPNGEDPVLSSLKKELKAMSLKWVGYLSTTGVYGDCSGGWVSEDDSPQPNQPRSKRRLKCEQAWLKSGLPVQILRLPGIYGPGRSILKSINSGNCKVIDKPGQVFSRIHIDDIAGATFHLIHLAHQGNKPPIINIVDNLPCSNIEVLNFGAKLLGHSLPPLEPFETASKKMSSMALSFWQENRRVSNQKLCQDLDYNLIHPDYQSGLKDCLLNEELCISKTNP